MDQIHIEKQWMDNDNNEKKNAGKIWIGYIKNLIYITDYWIGKRNLQKTGSTCDG